MLQKARRFESSRGSCLRVASLDTVTFKVTVATVQPARIRMAGEGSLTTRPLRKRQGRVKAPGSEGCSWPFTRMGRGDPQTGRRGAYSVSTAGQLKRT